MDMLRSVIASLNDSLGLPPLEGIDDCPPCMKRRLAKTNVPPQLKDYWFGRFSKAEHPRTECMEKLSENDSVDDPAALCQALYSEWLKKNPSKRRSK